MTDQTQSGSQVARDAQPAQLPVPETIGREPIPVPAATGEAAAESEQPSTRGPGNRAEMDAKSEFASFAHQYIREYISLADQKATFFFTGATALLAFLYNKDVSARWLKPLMQWNILDTIAFVAMSALSFGAFLALLVVIPRTPGSRRGFLFWEAVAEYESGRHYFDDLWRLSNPSLVQVKVEHCHELARVCSRKYRMLRYALWCGAVGLAGSLFGFLIL